MFVNFNVSLYHEPSREGFISLYNIQRAERTILSTVPIYLITTVEKSKKQFQLVPNTCVRFLRLVNCSSSYVIQCQSISVFRCMCISILHPQSPRRQSTIAADFFDKDNQVASSQFIAEGAAPST